MMLFHLGEWLENFCNSFFACKAKISESFNSKTKDLKEVCKRADILIAALGKPKFITEEYVKEGAVVIDVGIHRNENNKLCGDVDFDDVEKGEN